LPGDFHLPPDFKDARVCRPGVLAVTAPACSGPPHGDDGVAERFCAILTAANRERPGLLDGWPLIVLVDDAPFCAESLSNLLWVTFTRSNPAADVHGIDSTIHQKHWGCRGPLVIDARLKPHMAPPLESDPEIARRVDQLAARGGPLHDII
jgi:4-hydroxy-3-polyprenylbenzoate decarboxylase